MLEKLFGYLLGQANKNELHNGLIETAARIDNHVKRLPIDARDERDAWTRCKLVCLAAADWIFGK